MHEQEKISTTAIARQLDVPAREVFTLLKDRGWIERRENHWRLTGKGEFEGGEYLYSKQYGEYIGWPREIYRHRLFEEISQRPLTAADLGNVFDISEHLCNALLGELGWQHRFHRGWQLTRVGESLGGFTGEHEMTGVPYTIWPRDITCNERLNELTAQLLEPRALLAESADGRRDDSHIPAQRALDFKHGEDSTCSRPGLDGHQCLHAEDTLVDNWFYLMGVRHAYRRPLAAESLGESDFYLPDAAVHCEVWHAHDRADAQSARLQRLQYYRDHTLNCIELGRENLLNMDRYMPKELIKFGITVF